MLLVNNEDAVKVLRMDEAIDAIDAVLKEYYLGDAAVRPRIDLWAPCGVPDAYFQWGAMEGTCRSRKVFALRIKSDIASFPKGRDGTWTHEYFCQRPGKFCGLIFLFSLVNGEPLAILNDGVIQHIRVGATAGLAARLLALPEADTVGLLGSGGMARSHAEAFVAVRPIRTIKVYSPTKANREAYAREMEATLNVNVIPMESPELAVRESAIVAACTDSIVPVLKGEWLEPGSFVSTVKGSIELDDTAVRRVERFLTFAPGMTAGEKRNPQELNAPETHSSPHQAYVAGRPEEVAKIPRARNAQSADPNKVVSYKEILAGRVPGRLDRNAILSSGAGAYGIQGLQFASVAGLVYQRALECGLGRELPTDWFLQDIRN